MKKRSSRGMVYKDNLIIAIDGPAGAGKSTVARILAKKLDFLYIDTGAIYRAITLKAIKEGIDPYNEEDLIRLVKGANINLKNDSQGRLIITLDSEDVTQKIRSRQVNRIVSIIAAFGGVRKEMLRLQRFFGEKVNCVLEGRDIGTVVFPGAQKKFYIDAEFKERLKRRYKELQGQGQDVNLADVEKDIEMRDTIDSTRQVAPLKKAEDAIYVDTTKMAIEQVVDRILREVKG